MKNAYTPGPWAITTKRFSRQGVALEGDITVVTMPGPCEAVVVSLGATREEIQANAQLIAAAPAMYELLEKLAAICRDNYIFMGYAVPPNDVLVAELTLAKIRKG